MRGVILTRGRYRAARAAKNYKTKTPKDQKESLISPFQGSFALLQFLKRLTLQRKYKHYLFLQLIRISREISLFALRLHVLALTCERQLQSATLISSLLRGFLEACVTLKEDLFLFPSWELHSTLQMSKRMRQIRKNSMQDGEKPEQVLHGKDFGRSLSVQTIHSLLPLFLAQVLNCTM